MKVYHGSYIAIDKIDLEKCQAGKDFGRGFYVTKIRSQAEYWAERIGKENKTTGIVTEFDFHEYAYDDFDLKMLRFDGYSEEWLDFVVLNRANESRRQAHNYDIVEGPVADDRVTRRIFAYLNGAVSKTDFLEELKFFRYTHQIALCTVESLQMIERKVNKSEIIIDDIDEAITEALIINHNLPEEKAIDAYYESQTYKMLIDESTALYKKPWTEIYDLLLKELKLKK
ncbi:MAG: DUF3990 domain-containing protein [Dysgonamonadaceae bacterium]|jgi:hypothetical protein|nr:DUF3990 domain-containing protein [Dysgonamonadaceae bacterium]